MVGGTRADSNVGELVAGFQQEAAQARRQWANWLGVGSGGGVVALLSFAANLPNPDHALSILSPALAAFVLAIISAAPALLMYAEEHQSAAEHYAAAHNRDALRADAAAQPEWITAPRSMGDGLNAGRNLKLTQADEENEYAEAVWKRRVRWKWTRRVTMGFSALCFIIGASYPLWLITSEQSFSAEPSPPTRS